MAIVVTAINDKTTKNTLRYIIQAPADGVPIAQGSIYIQKWAVKELDNSKSLKITIEVEKES